MGDDVSRRIRYRGDPAQVGAMVRMLEEEGLTVRRVNPTPGEEREDVVLLATGPIEKIKDASGKMRHRIGGGAEVTVEGEDD